MTLSYSDEPEKAAEPPLPTTELHVWHAALERDDWPAAERLPAAERGRAAAMSQGKVRDRWVAARWALRGVLGRYLEREPATVKLSTGERGKPRLAAPEGSLHFNLSHSGELALIALAREIEVGIDVEQVKPRRNLLSLARRALPAEEAARIAALPPAARLDAFHAAWTRREAIAKCFGSGLAGPIPDAPAAVADLDLAGPGYAAAVAVAGETMPPLRRFTIEPAGLAAG